MGSDLLNTFRVSCCSRQRKRIQKLDLPEPHKSIQMLAPASSLDAGVSAEPAGRLVGESEDWMPTLAFGTPRHQSVDP